MESNYKLGEAIISEEEIEERAREIASKISTEYSGEKVLVVGILKGAVMWMSTLIKNITLPVEIDFMAVSSYGDATKSSGVVKILKDVDTELEDKNVIIVEDIVDSGVTLNFLKKYFLDKGVRTLKICTLLDKPKGRKQEIDVDYVGFTVEDIFIVGYGLDANQKFRNLPYITYLTNEE